MEKTKLSIKHINKKNQSRRIQEASYENVTLVMLNKAPTNLNNPELYEVLSVRGRHQSKINVFQTRSLATAKVAFNSLVEFFEDNLRDNSDYLTCLTRLYSSYDEVMKPVIGYINDTKEENDNNNDKVTTTLLTFSSIKGYRKSIFVMSYDSTPNLRVYFEVEHSEIKDKDKSYLHNDHLVKHCTNKAQCKDTERKLLTAFTRNHNKNIKKLKSPTLPQ